MDRLRTIPSLHCSALPPRRKISTWRLIGRVTILAGMIILSACTGFGPKNRQAVESSSPPAATAPSSTPAKPSLQEPTKRLTILALDPDDYKAGQKRRMETLLESEGNNALIEDNVGYYMEVQEAELRRSLGKENVRITSRGESIAVGPLGSAFASDSIFPANKIRKILDAIAPVLKEYAETLITIHVYTDSTGATSYNRKLSESRGLVVARSLVNSGIAGKRIVVVGHGESDPVASNTTAKGRAQNRRIEIELKPLVR